MNKMHKIALLTLAVLVSNLAVAQSSAEESFHANGSIRVVVAVAAIVLLGLFAYIFSLERRLKRLEKKD
jgi:CcmD family protein